MGGEPIKPMGVKSPMEYLMLLLISRAMASSLLAPTNSV